MTWLLLPAALVCAGIAAAAEDPGAMLWKDPGDVTAIDFAGTAGALVNPPVPPFVFLRGDSSGTQSRLFVRDAAGAEWNVKFGNEVKTEVFCWRFVRACGYFAEPSFFVPEGRIDGLPRLKRWSGSLRADGRFTSASFQFRHPRVKLLSGRQWRWDFPPLAGTRELSGLKILVMLFSNWNNTDGRAGRNNSNTGAFELREDRRKRTVYTFTNWGSGMGRWGATGGQTSWRCADYTAQTPEFMKRVDRGRVVFGWDGAIGPGFQDNIPPAHVAWLMQYLGAISAAQWIAGLKASGADDAEAACFAKALLARIDQLREVAF